MAGDYPLVRVGDVAQSVSETHKREKGRLIFLNTSDILHGKLLHRTYSAVKEWPGQAKKSVCKDDILFSEIRPANGRWAYIDEDGADFVVSTKLMVIRANKARLLPKYLYHFLTSSNISGRLQHLAESRSGTFPQITFDQVASLDIPLPSLLEQEAIACILGALNDKIEMNRRMNRTIEETAQAIFKSWFVDFDPVRAKAAGRQPPGHKPEIAALFPNSFEDSDLGKIPRGWRTGTIDGIAHINTWTLGRRDALDFIDYIEISEVMLGEVGTVTRYIRGEEPSRARRRLKHGDTILSTVRPDRGAYFLVLNPSASLIASTGFAVLTPKDGRWAFLHAVTTQSAFGQELGRLADGGAYPAIRPEVVGAREIALPNNSGLIAAFDKIAQPLFLLADMNRNECRTLSAIRDALLSKLISGELRVPDAERIAGRCA
jgi:type I restriction enzyme, S subunit